MTNDEKSDRMSDDEKALRARLARPIPLQAIREMAVCVGIDQLAETLDLTQVALQAALTSAATMTHDASESQLRVGWIASLVDLKAQLDNTDRQGRALIKSVRVMLILE